MRKSILASMGVLAMVAVTVIGCSKDEEWEDQYNLDVEYRTPTTRSSANGIEIGSSGPGLYDIPQYENECMLYAIVNIAKMNRIPINQTNGRDPRTIGTDNYSAASAYENLRRRATGQSWTPCDVYGKPIEGEESYQYTGGAMAPSVAASIGRDSGILKGGIMYFSSYDEMYAVISSVSFQSEHPNGTYYFACGSRK